ncbi:hypothetical protein QPL79_01890 [Ignisphaera sp. 4213-co]|uniref:Endonuclease n=1 Tax=Ignisphaera cupida TaxID=3050454 RepID=A0ABD4Z4P3_9CREN|nr:hypothetical protein [Ignisphaera sp. 4213-co]MDK6028115.1 hypothetical protein [Ignisphaera sp. 4213-co]
MESKIYVANENWLIELVASRFREAGFSVYKNIVVCDVEFDILAFEYIQNGIYVHIVEVKRRPSDKIYRQLSKRLKIADYLYVAIPYEFYSWALKRIDPRIGILLVAGDDVVVFRKPRYLGNGFLIANNMCNMVLRSDSR